MNPNLAAYSYVAPVEEKYGISAIVFAKDRKQAIEFLQAEIKERELDLTVHDQCLEKINDPGVFYFSHSP